MKNSLWILRALVLGVIVLGVLVLGPQPLMAQEGSEVQYFDPSQENPIRVDCGNGELYDWSGGALPVHFASMEVEISPGRWCSMQAKTPEWVIGMAIITIIVALLFVAAVFAFWWRIRRQNSTEVRLDEVFDVALY